MRVLLLAALICAATTLGRASALPDPDPRSCDLANDEEVKVVAVIDAGAFAIADGRHVRLAAIQAPMLSLGRANIADWPLAAAAKARLSSLILNKELVLAFDRRSVDRHGDLLAYAYANGDLVQGRLVSEGLARVHTQFDTRRCAAALLAREADARKAKRGIWALPFYAIRAPDALGDDIGSFQIVEGKVVSAAVHRDRIYLNFGADYRLDFTVTIAPRDVRRMTKDGKDPLAWNAKRVRVRGWISLLNGPEMEVTHPEQVEVLD